uniref:REJ domain-containing protein n=1 Tax=Lepeophtheirus salmonis TaxID=72036 RepID=A0A0K2VIM6_LEPSM
MTLFAASAVLRCFKITLLQAMQMVSSDKLSHTESMSAFKSSTLR